MLGFVEPRLQSSRFLPDSVFCFLKECLLLALNNDSRYFLVVQLVLTILYHRNLSKKNRFDWNFCPYDSTN